mmetsp:Transcript_15912/g.43989  ORF Transcript_15912/g.43989 Transcript_15912/m.43989 type:complete len:90 (-) Transcript_15912:1017-1286(-)
MRLVRQHQPPLCALQVCHATYHTRLPKYSDRNVKGSITCSSFCSPAIACLTYSHTYAYLDTRRRTTPIREKQRNSQQAILRLAEENYGL